jgi:hypothetical protein
MSTRDTAGLRAVLWHLRDFLPELVLIGGWVPHLYRMYGPFTEWRSDLAFTEEFDLLVETRGATATRPQSLAATLSEAGFSPVDEGAAVWQSAAPASQRIEFMTPHRGVARSVAIVVRLEEHPGMGALALEGLDLLRDFTVEIDVPAGMQADQLATVRVRVPTVGAYILSKAVTFPRRPAEAVGAGQPRRAKDILYIRDILSAGPEVVEKLEQDVHTIAATHHRAAVRTARSNVYLLLRRAMSGNLMESAEMLAERDRISQTSARADLEGHMTDLHEILEKASGE